MSPTVCPDGGHTCWTCDEPCLDTALRTRWLTAMRASTIRAIGRECDYARSIGDVDRFDPLGLLAHLADVPETSWVGSGTQFRPYDPGAWLPRQVTEALAARVGLDPACLGTLAAMNDEGVAWAAMADWVERRVGR